ncbi:MAG: class I SAM-dependent methyltransferase [Cyanobacteria bacterium P01_C01_bin.89]
MNGTVDKNLADLHHSARRLNHLIDQLGAKSYLEIGVFKGKTFKQVNAEVKYAVDPEFCFKYQDRIEPCETYFKGISDIFFRDLDTEEKLDIIFIDGLHTFEQSYRDFCNVLSHSHDKSIILIDDTLPNDPFSALNNKLRSKRMRRICNSESSKAWHGDVYKLIFLIHDFYPALSYGTIHGLGNPQTLVWKSKVKENRIPVFDNLEAISRLSYFDLIDNIEVLNIDAEETILNRCISSFSLDVN